MIQGFRPLRLMGAVAALSALGGCSGRAQTPAGAKSPAPIEAAPAPDPAATASPAAGAGLPEWMAVDSAGRVVTLSLEVTSPPGSPSALINGYREGEAQIIIPLGWTVKWNWRSADSTAPHSLVLMVEREKIPLEGGRPSLTNAMTRMVTEGLQAGQTDQTTFEADEAGWYWLLCGVPGHAIKGEWIGLKVDREAIRPGVQIKKT